MQKSIILPGDPVFDYTLANALPPSWHSQTHDNDCCALVMDATTNLLRPATNSELEDYLEGGEYEQVSEEQYNKQLGWSFEDDYFPWRLYDL